MRKQSLKKKVGKATGNLLNLKYLGDEPQFVNEPTDLQYMKALTWYNYMCTKADARNYIETYLKNTKRQNLIKDLRRVPDIRINDQSAWIARMLTRGAPLKQRSKNKFEELLNQSLTFAETQKQEKNEVTKQPSPSIQDRMRDKVSNFIGEIEEQIDVDGWTVSVYDKLQSAQLPAMLANRVAEYFAPISEEASQLLLKNCEASLKEGYSSYTKAQLKERAAFYEKIVEDCKRYSSNGKKLRVVRKKKTVTPEKKLKSFKFQNESKEYKVVSINPEKILGAEELLTFNTKYRLLTHFVALDRSGLNVKGTTILNYDEEKSKTYRIGRKTEENIEIALRGGKRAFTKMISTLITKTLQHRINENTILLKV
jgi:hypothetical protein